MSVDDELIEVVAFAIFKDDQALKRFKGERLPDRNFKVALGHFCAMA